MWLLDGRRCGYSDREGAPEGEVLREEVGERVSVREASWLMGG